MWLTALFFGLAVGSASVFAQAPIISDFTPDAGTPNDVIQISGSGFSTGVIRVYFHGVQASIQVTSDSLMQATVPPGVSTGPLSISRDGGQTISTAADFIAIGSGPYITSFSPVYGASNDLVVINGVHFGTVAPNGVKFGTVRSTDAFPNGDGTSINVHVPYGAVVGSNPITVTTSFGTSNGPVNFTVIGPGPYITGFSPSSGTSNTTVFIDGEHFLAATNATFNGVAGKNFAIQSDTLIRVDAPTNVSTGPIAVNGPLGSSTSIASFFVPPAISTLSTTNGRSGTNVTVTGSNFRGATGVLFGNISATFTVVNNTTIQTTVPSGATNSVIRVNTPYFSCNAPATFKILPTINSFNPPFGPVGTSVTISGANLNAGSLVVRFNGTQATSVSGVTFGQATAVVPAGATTGPISVSTVDGSYTNANKFYVPASISGFTPTNSAPGSLVTISGLNFVGASDISFNGASAVFTVSNNTTIGAFVPPGVSTGPIRVTTPAGTASSSGLFYAAPVVSSFSPTSGLPGTNVTILGTNFLGTRAVRFGGLSATVSSVNNGQIVAVAPVGVQTGPITVEAPAGTNTSAQSFVVNYPSDVQVWITDAPDPVFVTSNLVYSVTVLNHGPFDAPNVWITNTLPASVSLVSATMPPPWTITTNGNTVLANATTMLYGGQETLTITVAPQSPGTIINTANIKSGNVDANPANNSYATTTWVLPLPQLSIRWWTNEVRVSWPSALTNFLLQTKTNVADVNWTTITNSPTVVGPIQYVLEPTNSVSKYYRLKQ